VLVFSSNSSSYILIHRSVAVQWCKIHRQVYFALYVLCNSQNKLCASHRCSYTAKQRLRYVIFYTAQSSFGGVRYTANWRQVYFVLYVLCNSQNKLCASWRCSYTAEQRLHYVIFYTAQSPFGGVRYTANWRQVYFALYRRGGYIRTGFYVWRQIKNTCRRIFAVFL